MIPQNPISRFWIAGLVLVIGSPAVVAVRMMIGQHPDLTDWVYHIIVFLAGLFLLDKERAKELMQSLIPFWRKPNGPAG